MMTTENYTVAAGDDINLSLEMWHWCMDTIGNPGHLTYHYDPGNGKWPNEPIFIFHKQEYAVLFKLRWAGK